MTGSTPKYYLIERPGESFTWIGGELIPDGDHVWLATSDGKKVLRLKKEQVRPSSAEETARLVANGVKKPNVELN